MSIESIEVIRRVWNDDEGVYIEIGDYAEAPSAIEIRVNHEKSRNWFGELSIAIEPEYAKKLGQALIDAAKDKGI